MTVGVYGLVAGIVKLDDLGLYLSKGRSGLRAKLGLGIIKVAPYLMKMLGIAGTVAMFLVGGGILTHGVHAVDVWIAGLAAQAGAFGAVVPILANLIVGVVAGSIVLLVVNLVKRLRRK
jgi:predicted DNA repair protein MutK